LIRAGQLERRAILRTYGVAIHEVLHAKHTKLWVTEHDRALAASADPDERQLAADRALLEEPRMEATGCRAYPDNTRRGRFVRLALGAAVIDCIVPRFAAHLALTTITGQPVSRDLAGRALTYLHARAHYGVVDPSALAALEPIWRQVLGRKDVEALDDLYAQLIWSPTVRTSRCRSGRAATATSSAHPTTNPGPGATRATSPARAPPVAGEGPPGGRLAARGARARVRRGAAREGQLEQLDEDADLASTLEHAATGMPGELGTGSGTGAPTGRMPDRGVDRRPFPDEVHEARRLAQRLLRARRLGLRRIDKRTPADGSTAAPTPARASSARPDDPRPATPGRSRARSPRRCRSRTPCSSSTPRARCCRSAMDGC
jgi:hypothetical protein